MTKLLCCASKINTTGRLQGTESAVPSLDKPNLNISIRMFKTVSVVLALAAVVRLALSQPLPRLGGVNTAGYDFTIVCAFHFPHASNTNKASQYKNGTYKPSYGIPPASQYSHFTAEGVNLYRIRERFYPLDHSSSDTSCHTQHLVRIVDSSNGLISDRTLALAWQLMTPTLGGTIDSGFFSTYDTTVKAALNSGPNVHVIIDVVRGFLNFPMMS